MKFLLIPLCFLFSAAPAWSDSDRRHETEHLIIRWAEDAATDEDLVLAERLGERFYTEIRDRLGHEPRAKVAIQLGGPAEQPDGSWEYPRVDRFGRVLLFRYDPSPESYFNALAHEMVHVFRFRSPDKDWFFEEAFAEFVALRIDPSLDGFPWYGFPVHVVAGQWFENDEDIPLSVLRERHRAVNLPCKAQSYSLRAAFFSYLGDTHGDDRVFAMAGQSPAGALVDYEAIFGKSFEALEKEWRDALRADYAADESAGEQAKAYRRTPVQYMRICREGDGF